MADGGFQWSTGRTSGTNLVVIWCQFGFMLVPYLVPIWHQSGIIFDMSQMYINIIYQMIYMLLDSKPERPENRKAQSLESYFSSAGMLRLNTKNTETTDRLGCFCLAASAEHHIHEKR